MYFKFFRKRRWRKDALQMTGEWVFRGVLVSFDLSLPAVYPGRYSGWQSSPDAGWCYNTVFSVPDCSTSPLANPDVGQTFWTQSQRASDRKDM